MDTRTVVVKVPLNPENRQADGSYLSLLENPINFAHNDKLYVSLEELSLEYVPLNFTKAKNRFYFKQSGTIDDWTEVSVGTADSMIENIELVIYMISHVTPAGFKTKIKFEFNERTNRVFLTTIGYDVKLSWNLSSVLGFKRNLIFPGNPAGTKSAFAASFQPSPLYRFEYVYLCCDLVANSNTPSGQMPLLRSLAIPTMDLGHSKRVSVYFGNNCYVPVVSNFVNSIRFQFFDTHFSETLTFPETDENAFIILKFKRMPFDYPI